MVAAGRFWLSTTSPTASYSEERVTTRPVPADKATAERFRGRDGITGKRAPVGCCGPGTSTPTTGKSRCRRSPQCFMPLTAPKHVRPHRGVHAGAPLTRLLTNYRVDKIVARALTRLATA